MITTRKCQDCPATFSCRQESKQKTCRACQETERLGTGPTKDLAVYTPRYDGTRFYDDYEGEA
jgi:hypothetical protein